MAKRRKTKRQKVASDSRHLIENTRLVESQTPLSQTTVATTTYTIEPITSSHKTVAQTIISVSDYQYLLTDIRKIALVTALIILVELGIFWTSNGF